MYVILAWILHCYFNKMLICVTMRNEINAFKIKNLKKKLPYTHDHNSPS